MSRIKNRNIDSDKIKEYTEIVNQMMEHIDIEKIDKIKKAVCTGKYMKTKNEIRALAEILIDEIN
ncbi:hypothetical protein HY745_10160 [Candidatus Desantisbacteria bacterium]|nr:hypothetical protein [Candidatus Desantisbacteria bacterium]